jgi:methionyl-tRNA formyltransferase
MKIIIATIKSWNIANAYEFKKKNEDTLIITNRNELTLERLSEFQPEYVFFPHWSNIIPKEIYENFQCVVFHMTDLPFGRGGSPLQNLIVRGFEKTKISAIKVGSGLDSGDIYLKKDLNLYGTAEEIYMRASKIIFDGMIPEIMDKNTIPEPQIGKAVLFKRRNTSQGEIKEDFSLETIYDYMRMLDAEDYPKAFINFGSYKLNFSRASLKHGKIVADVEIERSEYE